jgi:four helix bundle protein
MREGLDALENRTKAFTVQVIELCVIVEALAGLRQVAWQLSRSAGSVGANDRAMRSARSTRDFIAKLQIVNEEIDEAVLWLEIVQEVYPGHGPSITPLQGEGLELRAIFARARSTTRRNQAFRE